MNEPTVLALVIGVVAILAACYVARLAFRHAEGTQRRHEAILRDFMNRVQAKNVRDLERMSAIPPPPVEAADEEEREPVDDGRLGPTPNHPTLAARPGNWRWVPPDGEGNGGVYRIFSGPLGDREVQEVPPHELDGVPYVSDTPASVAARGLDEED